jgi:cellulose synthase/poly-beta-1,6-N-acetylglucosamine synthase-like glycosyltransferase
VHGWDPFNVTEDADLGCRLRVLGYDSAVLDSFTLEEANSDAINWVKQRSRWHKGYLQTGLVHIRRPRRFVRQLGWKGAIGFMALIPGTPILCALNALTLLTTMIWWLGGPKLLAGLYPGWLLYPSILAAVLGNAATVFAHIVIAARSNRPYLAWTCFLLPVYWLLMTMAAVKAAVQLITNPSYWEKTTHGLHRKTP